MQRTFKPASYLIALCAAMLVSPIWAFEECGPLGNAYGPFDFYTDKEKLPIVEGAHFTPSVEFLRQRLTGPFGGDIDYTLRAFPNHPRALAAMIRLGEWERSPRPGGARYTVFCYLERAVRFRPEDGTARLILATYLLKQKRTQDAVEHLKKAEELSGDNGNLHYNLGLAYFELKEYKKALHHAHNAYRLGFDLPGLRKKLESVKEWQAPPAPPPPESDTTNSAGSDPSSPPAENGDAPRPGS